MHVDEPVQVGYHEAEFGEDFGATRPYFASQDLGDDWSGDLHYYNNNEESNTEHHDSKEHYEAGESVHRASADPYYGHYMPYYSNEESNDEAVAQHYAAGEGVHKASTNPYYGRYVPYYDRPYDHYSNDESNAEHHDS